MGGVSHWWQSSRFTDVARVFELLAYAAPATVVAVVGILLGWRWRSRMPRAARRIILAFVLQLVQVVIGVSENLYIREIASNGSVRRLGVFIAVVNAVQTVLHSVVLGLLLWAVHGAYRARGDVERFI